MLALGSALSAVAQAQTKERTLFELDGPRAVIEWVTDSTFRFCRAWERGDCDPLDVHGASKAKVQRTDGETKVTFRTDDLEVEIQRPSLRLRVLSRDGKILLVETQEIQRAGTRIEAGFVSQPGERYYGLGIRVDASANLRGRSVETSRPFLISSLGYGLYCTMPGLYRFDLGEKEPNLLRLSFREIPRFEYWFHYGPTVKAIYEEHLEVVPPRAYAKFELMRREELPEWAVLLPDAENSSWRLLEDSVRAVVHASLSGILNPAFDVGLFASASPELFQRAMQLASVLPLICNSRGGTLGKDKEAALEKWLTWRKRLIPFFLAYVEETRSRGLPMIHPMVMQFPRDEAGRDLTDQFMVGDELLAAPIFTPGGRRKVYLPMGQWTEWHTNRRLAGRQVIEIEAPDDVLPLFARNGSIVPLDGVTAGQRMELHYFPRLAAELFLYEPELMRYSQMHAAPALDLLRLEIDSKVERSYEWVVHHVPKPAAVTGGDLIYEETKDRQRLRPGSWYFDAGRQNVHIAVLAGRGERLIVHLHPGESGEQGRPFRTPIN
ncbi:MAG: hypothetical protein K6T61_05210 [Bryobacteraceae bacterium]|nr:hypothetical protein [Bryobacteraceae bacterium]